MCGVIMFSMSRSMTLKAVLSSVMDLYEVTSVWSLMGLTMEIMVPCSHVSVILQCGSCNLLDQRGLEYLEDQDV